MCIVCASNYTQTIHKPYIEAFKTLHSECSQNYTHCYWTRISRMEFRTRMVRMEQMERMVRIVRNVCNERYVRYERYERKTGNGNRRWRASSLPPSLPLFDSLSLPISFPPPRHSFPPPRHSRAPLQKSNNFERIFSDLTLTFLTYRNTFRLPILPTRRIIFLCLPQIKIRGRQRKTRGRQILTGCASKIPVFKGKVTKKGRSRGSSHISIQI